jgi:hypothetical protein
MAQCYMGLLTFLAVQEAAQWDLRSLFYVHPSIVLFVFSFLLLFLLCRFFDAPVIILFGAYSPSFRA